MLKTLACLRAQVSCSLGLTNSAATHVQWWDLTCEPLDASGAPLPPLGPDNPVSQTLCTKAEQVRCTTA